MKYILLGRLCLAHSYLAALMIRPFAFYVYVSERARNIYRILTMAIAHKLQVERCL